MTDCILYNGNPVKLGTTISAKVKIVTLQDSYIKLQDTEGNYLEWWSSCYFIAHKIIDRLNLYYFKRMEDYPVFDATFRIKGGLKYWGDKAFLISNCTLRHQPQSLIDNPELIVHASDLFYKNNKIPEECYDIVLSRLPYVCVELGNLVGTMNDLPWNWISRYQKLSDKFVLKHMYELCPNYVLKMSHLKKSTKDKVKTCRELLR